MLTPEQIKAFDNMPSEKVDYWLNYFDYHGWWLILGFIACFFINGGWQGHLFIVIFAIQGWIKSYLAYEYMQHRVREFEKKNPHLKK